MSDITISKADLKARDQKINDLQRENTALKAKNSSDNQQGGGDTGNVSAIFSKDDQEVLGELAEPMMRLVQTAMSGVTKQLTPTFEKLASSMTSLEEQVQNQNKNLFSGVASTTLKNYDKVKGTDEFASLLDKRVPGTNITFGDSWADAEERNSFSEMQEIIDMVELESNDDSETDNEPANFEPTGGSSADEQRMTTQFKYKASDLKTKMDAYKAGEINNDDFDSFEEKFNEAVDAGQVLDDLSD